MEQSIGKLSFRIAPAELSVEEPIFSLSINHAQDC